MNTPLYDAIKDYISKDFSRFHMPGHKGAVEFDVTELPGIESLYGNKGAIAHTEKLYSEIYGTKASFLSAGGSTLCIQAMLTLACPPGSKIIMARGVHTSCVSAMALLDLHPVWLMPVGEHWLSTDAQCATLHQALTANPDASAVYITSPSYYGIISDVAAVSAVCREFNVPLLCDNAHGAYLRFLPDPMHPMDLGADMCCDSLHKTLPALTGAALLHINNERFIPGAKRAMSLFGSTSPSFLILLSADLLLPYLAGDVRDDMRRLCKTADELRTLSRESGCTIPQGVPSPLHLTLGGKDLSKHLEANHITPEYTDSEWCVLLLGVGNTDRDYDRLRATLALFSKEGTDSSRRVFCPGVPPGIPEQVCSIREATFAPSREIRIDDAAGKIAAGMVTACPPGIPVLISGERIDNNAVTLLKNSGILSINVVY